MTSGLHAFRHAVEDAKTPETRQPRIDKAVADLRGVGLVTETAVIKRIGTPVMGASILLGLLTAAVRLRAEATAAAEPA